jgi:hypothetical protein
MKKDIIALLKKGNLTPKERYLILIQNDVIRDTTGKEPLTEADKRALENWQAKTTAEAKEWNMYNEAWKLSGRAGLEAEVIYLQTMANHYRKSFIDMDLRFYPFYYDAKRHLENLETIKPVNINEALDIIKRQREEKLKEGLNIDYAIYQLAFNSLSKELQEDLKILYEEVEYEPSYLYQEEKLKDLLDGQDKPTKEAKEKLADLISKIIYNSYAKQYQLFHYFASIPVLEIVERFLIKKGIELKDIDDDNKTDRYTKIIEDYARDNKTTIEEIVKETCLEWLDDDLLEKHKPLFMSDDKNAIEGNTKNTHSKIFAEWLKAKDEAKKIIQGLIDNKTLELTADKTGQDKTITGDSLYAFNSDYKFVKDFKEQVDRYDANLGLVYADDDPEHKGKHLDRELLIADKNKEGELAIFSFFGMSVRRLKTFLKATEIFKEVKKDGDTILDFNSENIKKFYQEIRDDLIKCYSKHLAFLDIFKKLSKTYEADVAYIIKDRIKNLDDFIDEHNKALQIAIGQGDETGQDKLGLGYKYKRDLKLPDNLFIDKNKILADIDTYEIWSKKFEDILGDNF